MGLISSNIAGGVEGREAYWNNAFVEDAHFAAIGDMASMLTYRQIRDRDEAVEAMTMGVRPLTSVEVRWSGTGIQQSCKYRFMDENGASGALLYSVC
ncbi:hypothetical protein C5167_003646 [Papaver somniferum]|uniref:Uncharacterized protein n=1 Tax=Papaver somniferum TaxID=3469 RepID=A0A4Y7L1H8_PAPSO|nr:hypothetical protein C5167_003646 [Papaver somniferum]